MPILVFYMNDGPQTRRLRRSTGCPEGSPNCCGVRSLEINFRSIGWDYIMAPTKIMANYCAGPCNGISFLLWKNVGFFSSFGKDDCLSVQGSRVRAP